MQNKQHFDLTPTQKENRAKFRAFVDEYIVPHADMIDRQQYLSRDIMCTIAQHGYWGAEIPEEYGGAGMDLITYGLLSEEMGRGCANIRNLLGVQGMVSLSIGKWGNEAQKKYWLPQLASGDIVAAFALTEPDTGSDAKQIQTTATASGTKFVLSGQKKWISFGQSADLFLVFAQCEGKPTAFLVERNTPGFSMQPLTNLMGYRGSMLAELTFDECLIPETSLLGNIGTGVSHVASYGLIHGRYSTAWGCVGLAQACLEASLDYTSRRKQFGTFLRNHQLIQRMLANMITYVTAARLLCCRAGHLQDAGDLNAVMETSMAKYFASQVATQIASDAVQIHGANGCGSEYPVQRYLRDAKIAEIVEGSTEIQQMLIGRHVFYRTAA